MDPRMITDDVAIAFAGSEGSPLKGRYVRYQTASIGGREVALITRTSGQGLARSTLRAPEALWDGQVRGSVVLRQKQEYVQLQEERRGEELADSALRCVDSR